MAQPVNNEAKLVSSHQQSNGAETMKDGCLGSKTRSPSVVLPQMNFFVSNEAENKYEPVILLLYACALSWSS